MPIEPDDDRLVAPHPDRRRATLRTRSVRAGVFQRSTEPLAQPIYQTAAYGFGDSRLAEEHFSAGNPVYARDGLPNVRTLERIVADLEGAEDAVAVASGMAAIAATLFTHLNAGDHVVAPAGCYRDTTALLTDQFARFGIGATFVDAGDRAALAGAVTPSTRLMLVETISNPGMALADLPSITAIAHEHDLLVCVDNTFATPALCRPIEYGADLVVHSAGKFLGGHHDLTAGVVVGRRTLIELIRRATYLFGPTLAPMEAWLTVRGIKTLLPRMTWISQTAATVAASLAAHPAVSSLRYPGLPERASEDLTRRLLPAGAGGVMAFDLAGGADAAERFIGNLRAIPYAPTVGGTSSIVSYPPQTEATDGNGSARPRGYRSATVRLSIGLEDPGDLIDDLCQALDSVIPLQPAVDRRSLATWEVNA
jgi:methionine-gamma-lyase